MTRRAQRTENYDRRKGEAFFLFFPRAFTLNQYIKVPPLPLAFLPQFPSHTKTSNPLNMMATTSIQEEPPRRFQPPGLPTNEKARLAALHSLNILDTSSNEERFDSITREVQKAFDIPFVFISLVDRDRQWFKSTQWGGCPAPPPGGTPRETARDISFCGHAICGGGNQIMVVPDALLDDRFADNPLVTGPPLKIRFYAGCPLNVGREDSGEDPLNIGTLCMIDPKPREMTRGQLKRFRAMANKVKREIMKGYRPSGGFVQ